MQRYSFCRRIYYAKFGSEIDQVGDGAAGLQLNEAGVVARGARRRRELRDIVVKWSILYCSLKLE